MAAEATIEHPLTAEEFVNRLAITFRRMILILPNNLVHSSNFQVRRELPRIKSFAIKGRKIDASLNYGSYETTGFTKLTEISLAS
jgi:hypothetical protein